jgi:NADPH:quinone reductase-like Zn-dependent oxidoreductase
VIVFEEISRPVPAAGEALVRVVASGVAPWDSWIRAGRSKLPQPLPLTLGSDIAGVVEAIGPGVTTVAAGADVYGVTNPRFVGANAEFATASADMISSKPGRLSFTEAASVPVVAVTAWQMLFEHAQLQAGQTVLVHGAAGNVGSYAVQLARRHGVHVIATARAHEVNAVRQLGASDVVDVTTVRFENVVAGVDAVIDTVGGDVQARSFATLRPGGILVSAVAPPDVQQSGRDDVRGTFFIVDVKAPHLTRITALFDAGELTAHVGAVLPLSECRSAHEMIDGLRPRPTGKIVLSDAA